MIIARLLLALLLIPSVVYAELALDLYGGVSASGRTDLDTKIGAGKIAWRNLSQETTATGGARATVWLSQLPWLGIGVDAFYLEPSVKRQNVRASVTGPGGALSLGTTLDGVQVKTYGAALDLRLRAPLMADSEYPAGRIQPTASVGPALLLSDIRDGNNFSPAGQSDRDTRFGLKVNAGVTAMLTSSVGIFAEYRFLWYQARASVVDNVLNSSAVNDFTIQNHAVLGGLSLHF